MHAQAFRACLVRIFIGLSLGSVGPEDWLVILRPGGGQRGHVVIFALRYLNKLIYFDQLVI